MSFLQPFMQERDTCSNLRNESDDDDDESNEDEYNDTNNYREDEGDDKRVDRYDNKNYDKNDDMDKEVCSKKCKGEKKQKEIKKKINVAKEDSQSQPETASAVMMKYLLDKKNSKGQIIPPIQQPDATDMFFSSIAATIKNFSPYYQNIAKSQIFSIVTDLEMKQIIQGQSEQRQGFGPITSVQRSAQMKPHYTGPYNILHPVASRLPSPLSTTSTASSSSMIATPIPSPSPYDYPGTVIMPHHSEETEYSEI